MHRITLVKILTLLLLVVTISVKAQHSTPEKVHVESKQPEKGNLKAEIKAYIDHHLQDSYDFTFFTIDEKEHNYASIPLPIILID